MKKKTQKIIICISLVVMLFVNFSGVFGATNPEYTPTVNVSENALDTKIKDSILLDALANMINAIASLAEYLIGAVFSALTGDNIFPWADRIIFNGIGFLDINFLNPAENSLFVSDGETSILGEVVQQVYSSIFSLAVLFLGVAVGVMAIRLAISSIAAEKAKYKQAIVNWATCIVMLFLMHYILAFVFWVNEQLVRVASGVLIQTIEERKLNSVDFTEALNAVVTPKQRVALFCETAKQQPVSGWDFLINWFTVDDIEDVRTKLLEDDNAEVANRLLINTWYVDNRLVYVEDNAIGDFFKSQAIGIGQTDTMVAEIGLPRLLYDVEDAAQIKNFLQNKDQMTINNQKSKGYYQGVHGKIYFDKQKYLESQDFRNDVVMLAHCWSHKEDANAVYEFYKNYPRYKINTGDNPNKWQSQLNGIWASANTYSILGYLDKSADVLENIDFYIKIMNNNKIKQTIAEQRIKVDQQIISAATGVKSNTTDIIANLGSFFKQSAYVYTTEEVTTGSGSTEEVITGWRASKISVTGALLYAIFIFQSCMYFIMYVKRLFYVIMLSMFGPVVVIYDFFMKSAS